MIYNFAFPYDVASRKLVFVTNVVLVNRVVLVSDNVFVPNHALCWGTIKHLSDDLFAAAKVATACACAIHFIAPIKFFWYLL